MNLLCQITFCRRCRRQKPNPSMIMYGSMIHNVAYRQSCYQQSSSAPVCETGIQNCQQTAETCSSLQLLETAPPRESLSMINSAAKNSTPRPSSPAYLTLTNRPCLTLTDIDSRLLTRNKLSMPYPKLGVRLALAHSRERSSEKVLFISNVKHLRQHFPPLVSSIHYYSLQTQHILTRRTFGF